MPEEKTQHFPRCVRSPRIRVGARRATSRPRVGDAVDIPMLYDFASARVGMSRSGVGMASRYLPAMHLLSRLCRSDGMFDNVGAVVGMHGGVAVAVKNNGRDHRAARHSLTAAFAALAHGGERRGHIGGGSAGEAGMDPDRRV